MKRIIAIIGVVILVALYIITLITAFIDQSALDSWFKASLFCTMLIPTMLWIYLRVYVWIKGDKKEPTEAEKKESEKK